MQFHFSSGECDVVCSGQTFLYDSELRIDVDTNAFSFAVVFQFSVDTEESGVIIRVSSCDSTVTLRCINFGKNGAGSKTPIELATIAGRRLYVAFWSSVYGDKLDSVRNLLYTFFYEKDISCGKEDSAE